MDTPPNPINPVLDPITACVIQQQIGIPYTTTDPTTQSNVPSGYKTVYFDGIRYWFYVYENGAWRTVHLDGKAFPVSPAQGDVLYWSGTAWSSLAAGTVGYKLQTNGAGANPTWVAGISSEHFAFTAVANTNTDTTSTHTFGFVPQLIIGTYRYTSDNTGAIGIWLNNGGTPFETIAPIASGALGSVAGGGFLGISTGTPGVYFKQISLSASTITFHYANSSAGDKVFDIYAIG